MWHRLCSNTKIHNSEAIRQNNLKQLKHKFVSKLPGYPSQWALVPPTDDNNVNCTRTISLRLR
jgi:hypothetical protein